MAYLIVVLKLAYGFKDEFFLAPWNSRKDGQAVGEEGKKKTLVEDPGTKILRWIAYWETNDR
jgi:hypothetical protein